ncbi:P-loop containing nucleoside triphosphate hydrolase protein [Nemania sp. FL0031]|nr:P-loop containing nucleoside triphosphate hydrolase protein [Nemania sp. FL0031]
MDEKTKPVALHDCAQLIQTQDHRSLLDVVDSLRSRGIDRYVDLPQIIVCGDQSSGKSSVLEAISGLSFPTKDSLCTRFATELILRRDSAVAFRYLQVSLDLSEVVEAAKQVMGLDSNDNVFSKDILRVEISGPTQPHLTMVDLPGLFLAGNKDQSDADAKLVEDLVLSYMRKPRSIILAVVSAKNDFALQQVTRHARALDPKGTRTLGLITKPDTLDVGSDSEKYYVELAQNRDVVFRLGWHVLRNRSYTTRNASTEERNQAEAEFFSTGVWTKLHTSQLGVVSLRTRLSNVLYDQIVTQLPSVLENVETGIRECKEELLKLGAARSTLEEQKRYLFQISTSFTSIINASVDGNYTGAFFANMDEPNRYSKRMRAVTQNMLSDFANTMRTRGQAKIIHEQEEEEVAIRRDSRYISRVKYIEGVKKVMKESRGRELPGTYNPLVVAELFSRQCKPWENLVLDLGHRIFISADETIKAILSYVADDKTAEAIYHKIIIPSMQRLRGSLKAKLEEILHPHLAGHPITYNPSLLEKVQEVQAARRQRAVDKELGSFFGRALIDATGRYELNLSKLQRTVISIVESNMDMDTHACSMAIDMMEAYYEVTLVALIDQVGVLAIERCLIDELPKLLLPDIISNLIEEEVTLIAVESELSAAERKRLNEKLSVLQGGLIQLGKFRAS